MLKTPCSIVSVEWLNTHLNASGLVILDTSIPKVTDTNTKALEVQIPNARFFDLKQKFSDVSAPFPTTFPSAEQFTKEAQKLGINTTSTIVVYDDKGIYSSPRAWWLFKAFGYHNVAVLDGGLPEWKNKGYSLEAKKSYEVNIGDFEAQPNLELMKFFEDVKAESENKTHLIVDARSANRFKSIEPEPRAGLRSGTIPNSVNMPFVDLLDGYVLKNKDTLQSIFSKVMQPNDKVTFSCGSGITACVLALGAEIAGYKNLSVYDGSWTEWGSLT
jgi:thiosulfate/3-mercaptopyruvate sulfurtransferase